MIHGLSGESSGLTRNTRRQEITQAKKNKITKNTPKMNVYGVATAQNSQKKKIYIYIYIHIY